MLRVCAYFLPLVLAEVAATYLAWERFSQLERRFQYSIVDIWTMAVGMTPSFLLAAHTVKLIELHIQLYWPPEHLMVLLAVLVISQVLGVVIVRLYYQPPQPWERYAAFKSALSVLAGAVAGFVVLVFYVLGLKLLHRPF